MKRLCIFLIAVCKSIYAIGSADFLYLVATKASCNGLTHDIAIHYTLDATSDVNFTAPEIHFGDGNFERFDFFTEDYELVNRAQRRYKQVVQHTYEGPGVYTVSVRIFNRIPNIKNMTYSVNTPLSVELELVLDPMLGCNSTPRIENLPVISTKSAEPFLFDIAWKDLDNDSVSFALTSARMEHKIDVINYEIASDYDDSGYRRISRISIDPFTGAQLWNTKNAKGLYSIVLKMIEWRKIDGQSYKISTGTVDYLIDLTETENMPPEISGLRDTVLIVGNSYENTISIRDPEKDSVQMLLHGDFLSQLPISEENDYTFYPESISRQLAFTPKEYNIRHRPYKVLVSATDQSQEHGVLNRTESMNIWVTDRSHLPDPPVDFKSAADSQNLIRLSWKDAQDELGYILERADDHFPEFQKIATLPANATSFMDSSVVENNTYRYRIKAVGTTMSEYSVTEASTPDIVTAISIDIKFDEPIVFPNPSNGQFTISGADQFERLHIVDVTGKTVIESTLANFNSGLSPKLNSGIYILNLLAENESKQLKLEVF